MFLWLAAKKILTYNACRKTRLDWVFVFKWLIIRWTIFNTAYSLEQIVQEEPQQEMFDDTKTVIRNRK